MSDSNLDDYGGVVVFLMVLAFIGYGITVIAIGWIGIEEEFGFWWGVAAVVFALHLRITIPISIGAILGAMHLWGWHWALATLFAIPGLAFMIPAVAAIIVGALKNADRLSLKVKKNDSNFYLAAMNELKENRDEAAWAKCFAESYGEIQKAEAAYIRLRVQYLKKKTDLKVDIVDEKIEDNKYSPQYFFNNKLYTAKSYGQKRYMLLYNNNAALLESDVVHVYLSESDFFEAIDKDNLNWKCKLAFSIHSSSLVN